MRRRPVFVVVLVYLLGGVSSLGALTAVQAYQGGLDLATAEQRAVEVAALTDDQQLVSAANAADLALASNDHQLFSLVSLQAKHYTDGVVSVRSALSFGSGGPEPQWFYQCFDATMQAMRGSARIFDAASGLASWSAVQTGMIRQTVTDLDSMSRDVDFIANGGALVTAKSTPVVGQPEGSFDPRQECTHVVALADTLAQQQWPSP